MANSGIVVLLFISARLALGCQLLYADTHLKEQQECMQRNEDYSFGRTEKSVLLKAMAGKSTPPPPLPLLHNHSQREREAYDAIRYTKYEMGTLPTLNEQCEYA